MNRTKLLPRVRIELTTFRFLRLFFVIMRLTRCLLRYRGCYIQRKLTFGFGKRYNFKVRKEKKTMIQKLPSRIFEDRWSLFRGDRFTWFDCILLMWNVLFSKVWFAFGFCLFCCFFFFFFLLLFFFCFCFFRLYGGYFYY